MEICAAAVNMTSTDSPQENLAVALRFLQQAASRGATWLVYPENLFYCGEHARLRQLVRDGEFDRCLLALGREAASVGITVFAGTVPVADVRKQRAGEGARTTDNLVSRLHVLDRSGACKATYDKVHLFSLADRDGTITHQESETYAPGSKVVVTDVDGARVGLAVCYDVRFAGMFLRAERLGRPPDVWVLPAAFTQETGRAHWEVLVRARAIESQCYWIAATQTGSHPGGKSTWGHGMIVDPWGAVVASTGGEPGLAVAHVSLDRIREVRARLRATADRRWDLYG